jgi:hypothetical protein
MVQSNYEKLDKTIFTNWVDKALDFSMSKQNINGSWL